MAFFLRRFLFITCTFAYRFERDRDFTTRCNFGFMLEEEDE